jgi:hypothetical protein
VGLVAGSFAHVTPTTADDALPLEGEQYAIVFEHATLELGWYAPRGVDEQAPHRRDELYVVAAGHARFAVDGETERSVAAGDALFVAAGRAHRFLRMSGDFKAWVMFYGPEGGE